MTSRTKPIAIADVNGGLLLATIDIQAPMERVFKALTSEELVQWWGDSASYHAERWSGDVRAGGRWQVEGRLADGAPYSVGGVYETVDPPRALTCTWEPSWQPGKATRVSYLLSPTDHGTRLTVRHELFDDPAACADHAIGWERVLTWLADHLANAA